MSSAVLTISAWLCFNFPLTQVQASGRVEGRVLGYGEYTVVVTDNATGIGTTLRTTDGGKYSIDLRPGRYRLGLLASPRTPFPVEHSAFHIASGEHVLMNLRSTPIERSSSQVDGDYVSLYTGAIPHLVVYYIPRINRSFLSDLRLLCYETRADTKKMTCDYATGSYEKMTFHAAHIEYDEQNKQLKAIGNKDWGDVLFEDGKRQYISERVDIDLTSGTATLREMQDETGKVIDQIRGGDTTLDNPGSLFVDLDRNRLGSIRYKNDGLNIDFECEAVDSLVVSRKGEEEEIAIRGYGRLNQIRYPFALKMYFGTVSKDSNVRFSMDFHIPALIIQGQLPSKAIIITRS